MQDSIADLDTYAGSSNIDRFDALYAAWLAGRSASYKPDIPDVEFEANRAERERVARELVAIPIGADRRVLAKLEVLEAALMLGEDAGACGEFTIIGAVRSDLAQL